MEVLQGRQERQGSAGPGEGSLGQSWWFCCLRACNGALALRGARPCGED